MTKGQFIGRQTARMKFAQSYITIINQIITSISLMLLVLNANGIKVDIIGYVFLIFLGGCGSMVAGYYLDTSGVVNSDYTKSITKGLEAYRQIYKESLTPEIEKYYVELLLIRQLLEQMVEEKYR